MRTETYSKLTIGGTYKVNGASLVIVRGFISPDTVIVEYSPIRGKPSLLIDRLEALTDNGNNHFVRMRDWDTPYKGA